MRGENKSKMTKLTFNRDHAKEAIRLVKIKGREWLYESYPKPDGQMRKSSTGFLMYEGVAYPVKPLGRLANEIAGHPMTDNPITNVFRKYFESLEFQLIESANSEAEIAVERQRRLANAWERPGQAKFRRAVFEMFGARCLVTGCEALIALEAAHVVPVSCGGGDEAWNGIPLRADIHRLFDAGSVIVRAENWTLSIVETVRKDYSQYHGMDLSPIISKIEGNSKLAAALKARMNMAANQK